MAETEFPHLINPVKRRLLAGELALGMVIRLARSGDIARIARWSGHDFLFLDVQHALFSVETLGHIAQAALGCGVAPLVRVGSCRDPRVAVMLDSGATGIVFPDVNTADDARLAVKTCKFAPIGERSLTGSYAVFDHAPVPLQRVMRDLNEQTLVVCMIESRRGLDNVEEIAAVPGVDVLLLGLTDLMADMGKPGVQGDPEAMAAVKRVAAAAKANGKFVGAGGDGDLQRQTEHIRHGIRFIPTQSDIAFMSAAATQTVAGLRAAAKSVAGG